MCTFHGILATQLFLILAWTGAVVRMSEAAISKCSAKWMLLKTSQNLQENTGASISF